MAREWTGVLCDDPAERTDWRDSPTFADVPVIPAAGPGQYGSDLDPADWRAAS